MKLIIAGGRNYRLKSFEVEILHLIHERNCVTEVVSGGAAGVDTCGEEWAGEVGLSVKRFLPEYEKYDGKIAPLERNELMAQYAEACICFPGGRGTDDMARRAQNWRLVFWDFRNRRIEE